MKRSSLQKTWMKNEKEKPASVELYIIPNLPNTLKMFESGVALLQNLDDNCECGLLKGERRLFCSGFIQRNVGREQ
jgi:hypothetical protein